MKETKDTSERATQDTEEFWEDPRKIMNLIDLLFLWEEDNPPIYS